MTKQTPIQLLEERVKQLENGAKYSDWHVKHWYHVFEEPLQRDVTELKRKEAARSIKEDCDRYSLEQAKKSKEKHFTGLWSVYWLSIIAAIWVGVVFTFYGLKCAGMLK